MKQFDLILDKTKAWAEINRRHGAAQPGELVVIEESLGRIVGLRGDVAYTKAQPKADSSSLKVDERAVDGDYAKLGAIAGLGEIP